jgi:autoinducer 2 (AI-2) kinase
MGILNDGYVGIVSGWSTPVQMITARPVLDPEYKIWTGCHVTENKWILESNSGESGNSLQWVSERLFDCHGSTEEESFSLLDRLAIPVPVGSNGVLAFTGPEVMDMRNMSLRWGGFIFPVPFSATGVNSAQLARAALENIGFAVRANLEQLEKIAGEQTVKVCFGGGLARNGCLKQILPAVLGCPVSFTTVYETSALDAECWRLSLPDFILLWRKPLQS